MPRSGDLSGRAPHAAGGGRERGEARTRDLAPPRRRRPLVRLAGCRGPHTLARPAPDADIATHEPQRVSLAPGEVFEYDLADRRYITNLAPLDYSLGVHLQVTLASPQ